MPESNLPVPSPMTTVPEPASRTMLALEVDSISPAPANLILALPARWIAAPGSV